MRLSEIEFEGQRPVDGYGPGFFRVAGEVYEGPILLSAAGLGLWKGDKDSKPLIELSAQLDVLFIGTGANIAPLPAKLKQALDKANVPYDVMSSPSACRTYNVLLGEGRRVGLAALPV